MATSGLINIGGGSSTPMTGATNLLDGESGAVPQPLAGEEGYLLSGAGTWVESPTTQDVTWGMNYWAATGSMTNSVTSFPYVATATRQTLAPTAQRIPLGVGTFTGSGVTRDTVNNRLVIETTGRYSISADMITTTATAAEHGIQLIKNGTIILTMNTRLNPGVAGYLGANLAWEGDLVATDYLELRGWVQIGTGTFFVDGGTFIVSQQPTAIAPVVNTVAEYIVPQYAAANVTPTSVQNTSANAAQFMAINIPSAGTWDIEWSVLGQIWQGNGGGTNDGIASGLYDAAGTFIANTELASASIASAGSTTGSNLYIQGTRSTTLVTTGATTYNVKVWNPNGLTRATAGSGVQGRSYIKANKIAGQLPSTGQTVDVLSISENGLWATSPGIQLLTIGTGTQNISSISSANAIDLSTPSVVSNSGAFTTSTTGLTAVKAGTYKIDYSYSVSAPDPGNVFAAFVTKNNSFTTKYGITTNQASDTVTQPNIISSTVTVNIAVGDTLEFRVLEVNNTSTTCYLTSYTINVIQLGSSNAIVTDNAALFGEQSLTATTIGNATVDIINGSFTLPSAGTWEVEYFGNISLNAGNIAGGLLIADASNVEVANSRSVTGAGGSGGGNESAMVSNKVRIITSAPTTYKIRGIGNAANIALSTGLAIGSVANKVTWNLIAGTVPSTGQTVDYVNGVGTNNTYGNAAALVTNTLTGNIPNASGVYTLTAGKTYRLQGSVKIDVANSILYFQWRNITGGTLIGAKATNLSANNTAQSFSDQAIAEAIITPSTNITVQLENTTGSSININAAESWVTITQLGSSAVIAGVYPGTWATYTPTITATAAGTNPTLPTSASIIGSYTVQGKVMLLNIRYSALAITGGTSGTQSYSFNLPPGFTIDLTKVSLPTDVTSASLSGFDGSTVGTGFFRNSTTSSGGTVVPVSSTGVGFFSENNVRLAGSGTFALNGAANASFSMVCQIPLI